MTTEERLEKLGSELAEIKSKRKDVWDKMSAFGSILIPIVLGAFGAFFTWQMKSAEIRMNKESEDAKLELSKQSGLTERKFRTAEMVSRFFQPLLSKDEKESELAKQALLLAAPEDSPGLLQRLGELSPGTKASRSVEVLLTNRKDTLIRQLFSESPELRGDAYNQLISNWADDETLIPPLISFARQNPDNENGVFNTLVLLSHMNRDTIKKKKVEILEFSSVAERNGSRTKERADKLRSRLE
jgi:hypothetical protein